MLVQRIKNWGKEFLWRFCGALFMEEKTLPSGKTTRAASLHRVLALVSFGTCFLLWIHPAGLQSADPEIIEALVSAGIDPVTVAERAQSVPDALVWTMWSLLGLNGGNKIAATISSARARKPVDA
jgi:hypothetical protein